MSEDHDDELEEEQETSRLLWERPYYIWKEKTFIPKIFQRRPGYILTSDFNAVSIQLDGQVQSSLDWKNPREEALRCIEKGLKLFWEIDLGLFSNLKLPLFNQTQYLSLSLALEHFRNTLWKEFHEHTIGLSLYRGSLDFSKDLAWNEEQHLNMQGWLFDHFHNVEELSQEIQIPLKTFSEVTENTMRKSARGRSLLALYSRNAATDYLGLLLNSLPDALQVFLLLDASEVKSPLECAFLLHRERFDRFQLAIKNCCVPYDGLTWEKGNSVSGFLAPSSLFIPSFQECRVGICLPSVDTSRLSHLQALEQALQWLIERHINFRLVPEAYLTTDWDGLDVLLVVPEALTSEGKRKLKGFCAAGGVILSLSNQFLGLPFEESFETWKQNF